MINKVYKRTNFDFLAQRREDTKMNVLQNNSIDAVYLMRALMPSYAQIVL